MNKIWQKTMMFAISLVLGIVLITQMRTKTGILGMVNLEEKSLELNEKLAQLNLEKTRLRDELEALKEKNREYEEIYADAEEELIGLSEELEDQKIISGYYDVKGPGTIITIDADPNSYMSLASSHQYILALISYLNNAGVEAISINGQRYTNYTEIVPVLEHINVNGVAMVLPLEIKAIGNSATINSSLNFVGGIVTQFNGIGYIIETEDSDEIFIQRYEGEKQFKYAVPIAREEEI
ncbi:MAG TPA: DUF881 domain-containing protein [Sedimentibacter sp.]|jgi:uncharacterized protein YlxW (UPF0749 family)|nr:DUF881 domain-containing protein [Sedimentibacter sp.]HNZ83069.1 DUF881 domain-containing protein [Sedimentibacter sp.]HOH69957.1 DUF881 domain-containing protein [Sedimentibacter sp.]